jgi:hypothetical protein
MQSSTSITQSIFVNKQNDKVNNKALGQPMNGEKTAAPIEGDFVRRGNQETHDKAQDVFVRNNEFAKMDNVSFSVKNGLQAYTSLDISNKKEEISRLMGVDLFA